MARPALEVADILNRHGDAFRARHRLSRGQLKVMGAIRACRTAALGGHVMRCGDCDHATIAYNSCRNRHCPRCQGAAAKDWLAQRQADLLPVPYYHLVFTLPAPVAAIAFQNKAAVYGLLFKAAAETLLTIAADPRHLGARIGFTSVLHTWGSAMTHHPHLHIIAPGGGLSADGSRWIACKPGFFLPVRVLSRLFRRLFLDGLAALHAGGKLVFFGELTDLIDANAFAAVWLRCDGPTGSSTPSAPSQGPTPSWPISPATPIASRSPTAASSPWTGIASPSAGRTIAPARPERVGSRP